MRVAAFLGSPRPGGNTDTLADAILDGAREAGLETDRHVLRSLRVHPCTGCELCWTKGRPCIFQDDGTALYDSVASSDVLLFATPVYWYGATAILKAFIDRLVVFNRPQGRPLVQGKRAVLVSAWEEKGMEAVEPLVRQFELSFRFLELRFTDRLLVDELGPRDAVRQRPALVARARALGKALVRVETCIDEKTRAT
ncbi:MAG TPA: flavodoxin family protein [Spirochaetia bacterium]|nr:flavodoxin family protein [Spirochaetia bacterium]